MSRDALAARLLTLFLAELEEQLRVLNADLMALERQPQDAQPLGSVFRVVHTLKGAAHAAHVPEVEEVCHQLESLLARAREGTASLGAEEFSLLFAAADALAEAGERLRAGRGLEDSPVAELRRRLRGASPGPAGHPAGRPSPARAAAVPEAVPERTGAEAGNTPAHSPPPVAAADAGREQVRIGGERLDALLAAAGHLQITTSRALGRTAELSELHELAEGGSRAWARTAHRLRLQLADAPAQGPLLEALEETEQLLRRVVHETGRLTSATRADTRVLAQATDQVVDRVRQLLLRPFSDACVALPRAVRDLASESGKEVRLQIVGGEVAADRAVLDVVHEVLLHLVRNAVDHGIEPPAERERVGKRATGTVTVAAALQGERLRITVADDGRGLDLAAIREQLVRRGARVPEGPEDLARVLFQAGFSTRAEATTVSGRGVGLDAVRTAIERIRGSVQVAWVDGQGTTVSLECPPALSTMRAVLVAVDAQLMAIPSAHIEYLARVRPEEVRRAQGREVILTGETPVPIVSLARLLGPPLRDAPVVGPFPVVRLSVGSRRLAVAVDEILSEEEVVVRPVERVRNPPPHLAGAVLLATGRVALVLNAAALLAEGLEREDAGPGLDRPSAPEAAPKRILVVDDSITTRTLEQSILEAEGFQVQTAVDGADGWRLLQEQPFDLVVSDVEMPRMDGFELCRAVRASKRLSELPIILVTALELPEHRARGLEAGADAYLPKSSFDQKGLLDTIVQLLG